MLVTGYEFVVSDQVPRHLGFRWLNARTIEVRPEVYETMVTACERPEALRRALRAIGRAALMAERAFAFLARLRALGEPPQDD